MVATTFDQVTTNDINGTGAFDTLMQSMSKHIQQEYDANRIRGTDYSTVYLGGLQSAMQQSIQFVLQKNQADLVEKQGQLVDKQIIKTDQEILLMQTQVQKMEFERDLTEQQIQNLITEKLKSESETAGIEQNTANAIIQGTILTAQECKIRAEFDLLVEQKLKTGSEISLLNQKKVTETAQVVGVGIDATSVIGKQNALYQAQTNGFQRDAEQKAAKIMVDTWGIRRTTDADNVAPTAQNRLLDEDIGLAVNALLTGVNA
jgi:uncharacterized protein (DUF3084 family)